MSSKEKKSADSNLCHTLATRHHHDCSARLTKSSHKHVIHKEKYGVNATNYLIK